MFCHISNSLHFLPLGYWDSLLRCGGRYYLEVVHQSYAIASISCWQGTGILWQYGWRILGWTRLEAGMLVRRLLQQFRQETIRSYIRAVKIGMERKESQELSQDSECEAKRKASSLILMAWMTRWTLIRPAEPEHSGGAYRCYQRSLASKNEQLVIISLRSGTTLYFVVWPVKYIKLFIVELCRGVRREVRLEEPIELNFLKYTILESSKSIKYQRLRGK